MTKKIDLHIHTNLSDGAFMNGVSVISIADHDTIDAYTKELFEYAKEKNIELIKGVEISTKTNKVGIHVLGYNFDLNNQLLKDKLYQLRNTRHIYLYDVSTKLKELGYFINVEELDKIETVTKAHIALDVVNNKDNEELLLKAFGHIPDKGEFIETIMNEGCPAYVKKNTITPVDASRLIKQAGGKVVLAHPVSYKYEDNLTEEEILKLVKEMDADGIEANYIYMDCNHKKIDETKEWNKFASRNHLRVTIGSDFHNKDGIHPEIGLGNEKLEIEGNVIQSILNFIM